MRTTTSNAFAVSLIALAAASPLAAQRPAASSAPVAHRIQWGPQVSFDFNGSNVGVGARLEYSLQRMLATNKLDGIAEINWYPGTVNIFDLTYNVVYRFSTPTLQPYAGGGLSYWIASGNGASGSDLHLDAVGGLKLKPMGRVTPVVQLRYVFVQGDALVGTFGVLF